MEEITPDGKVAFTNQRGKRVYHKPETLSKDPDRSRNEMPPEEAEQARERWREEFGASSK